MNPQRARTIDRQLRTGEVFFAGAPARYAPFFLPRVAALALSGPRGGLHLDAQVVEALTRPTATSLSKLEIAEVGREDPHHPNAGIPLLFGPRKEEDFQEIETWLTSLAAVPLSDRPARAFAHIMRITPWLEHERSADYLETLGIVSLEQFVIERLYGEITVVVDGGPPEKLFHSPYEFVATVLQHWGRGASEGNVSHLRACARIWIDLRAAGLPTPRRLHCLGPLITREDFIKIYTRLSKACRGVPTAKQIEDEVERLIYGETATKDPATPRPMTANQRLRWRVARVSDFVSKTPCENPVLAVLLDELFEDAKPTVAKKAPPRIPRKLPVYRQGLPCPFSFTERREDDGELILRIQVSPLPDPMPQIAAERMPDLRKRPKAERWLVHEHEDGSFIVTFALSANEGRAVNQRGEAYGWAVKLCRLMHAAIPERAPRQ